MPTTNIDTALVAGALSSPLWLHALTDLGQAALVLIGITVGVLRIDALWRARRRDRLPDPSALD